MKDVNMAYYDFVESKLTFRKKKLNKASITVLKIRRMRLFLRRQLGRTFDRVDICLFMHV